MKLITPRTMTILFFFWLVLIFSVSSIPSLTIPIDEKFAPDKVAHFGEYLILAFFFQRMMWLRKETLHKTRNYFLLLFVIAYLDELHQKLIPGRAYSLYDYTADALGIAVLFILTMIQSKKWRRT